MSTTASMWTGVSGLLAHGEKMNVIGNNIANVNTVGFKSSRMDFEDYVHQDINSAAGVSQVGRGVAIGAIYGDFSQGAFETSNEVTDIAVSGKGFFKVKPVGSDEAFYTRAGNFRFNKEGYLTDPHGYALQGWKIDLPQNTVATGTQSATSTNSMIKGAGVPVDVRLQNFSADPKHTSNVTLGLNLDSTIGGDKSSDPADPFFSLFKNWDATQKVPLNEDLFAYQSSIEVYDEGGTKHVLTVYFDQVSNDTLGDPNNAQRQWEFVVTMNPSDDMRVFDAGGTPVDLSAKDPVTGLPANKNAGILMTGTLSFDTGGQLKDMAAFTPPSATGAGDPNNLADWIPAKFSSNGYPLMVANFSGIPNASSTDLSGAQPYLMELNLGLKNTNPSAPFVIPGGYTNPAAIGNTLGDMPKMITQSARNPDATTSYSGSSSETTRKQDGYSYGFLQNITINQDGILSGRYSNGVTLQLYQITLYDFMSPQELRREGGNLFSETRESGDAVSGPANHNGYGSVHSNSLEQSNVDLAREFVQMITTQRGYQSNSKVITTVDTMLETVIQMKR